MDIQNQCEQSPVTLNCTVDVSPYIFRKFVRGLVVGPSCSGKTELVKKIIRHHINLFEPTVKGVIWFHEVSHAKPDLSDIKDIEKTFIGDAKDLIKIVTSGFIKDKILVIDDSMFCNEKTILDPKYSHHFSFHVFALTQNLFPNSSLARTISLNSNFLLLLKNCRDSKQISVLASQLAPGNGQYILDAYKRSTECAFSYLSIDLYPQTPDVLRVRGNIFSDEGPLNVFLPKLKND